MKRNLFGVMTLLLAADATGGGGSGAAKEKTETSAEKAARLEAELAQLKATNAELAGYKQEREARDQADIEREKIIEEKMKAGLTRKQAESVIAHQKAYDEAVEREQVKRRPEIISILKRCKCLTGRITKEARTEIREAFPFMVRNEIEAAQKAYAAGWRPEKETAAAA